MLTRKSCSLVGAAAVSPLRYAQWRRQLPSSLVSNSSTAPAGKDDFRASAPSSGSTSSNTSPPTTHGLQLEQLDVNLFRATTGQLWRPSGARGVFGGQIVGRFLRSPPSRSKGSERVVNKQEATTHLYLQQLFCGVDATQEAAAIADINLCDHKW